jgi:endonuclease/exonuclease/phosphatase family metal-dependent hydrolase
VNAVKPDVLALNECCGFVEDGGARMRAFCDAVGMEGELAVAPSGFHVGLLYRAPWRPSPTSTMTSAMHHGLVRMLLTEGSHEVNVVATHLNPYSGLGRLQEAQMAVGHTRAGEPSLVMGDFNSLPAGYDGPLFARRLMDEQMRPETHVCEYFGRAGFVDVLAARGVSTATYPTPLVRRPNYALAPVRLDYVMASPELASACTAAWAVDTPEAEQASDHLPIVAEFALPD